MNSLYDVGEFTGSRVGSIPNNLQFDYSTNPPSPVISIEEFTVIQDYNGIEYSIIDLVTISDTVYRYIPKIDSVITLFSHPTIINIDDEYLNNQDYTIFKSHYPVYDIDSGILKNQYDYSILTQPSHILKLEYPTLANVSEIYDCSSFENCFQDENQWTSDDLELDIIYYAENNIINSEDQFITDTLINTDTQLLNVTTDYSVDTTSVVVPMRKILFDSESNTCLYAPNLSIYIDSNEQCLNLFGVAALDTTLTNTFEITIIKSVESIGTGSTYKLKSVSYLSEGLGIVKEDLYYKVINMGGGINEWNHYSRKLLSEFRYED